MNLELMKDNIPGTCLNRQDMGNATGMEFLDKIFYITDGIMLSQVRKISGVDGSTLQNWVKRGWIQNTVNKRYNKDQVARILIINMLRDTLQLERIDFLLRYINGNVNRREDDIIGEAQLYDYICTILGRLTAIDADISPTGEKLRETIRAATADYSERISGARERLEKALEIIVISYYAALLKVHTAALFENL